MPITNIQRFTQLKTKQQQKHIILLETIFSFLMTRIVK